MSKSDKKAKHISKRICDVDYRIKSLTHLIEVVTKAGANPDLCTLSCECEYDRDRSGAIFVEEYRLETSEEIEQRLSSVAAHAKTCEERERHTLAVLQAKYGTSTG